MTQTTKQRQLAQELAEQLKSRGADSAVGRTAGLYGHKVRVTTPAATGDLVVYSGKKGPKLVIETLQPGPQLKQIIDEAWHAATGVKPVESLFSERKQPLPSTTFTEEATSHAPSGVEAWVDGSCVQSGSRLLLGWGMIVFKGEKELHRASGSDIPKEHESQRNVAAEILAVLEALRWCADNGVDSIDIYHDYSGLEKWAIGAWKTNNDYTAGYARSVRQSGVSICWHKIAAHTGVERNEMVDVLARDAALKSR